MYSIAAVDVSQPVWQLMVLICIFAPILLISTRIQCNDKDCEIKRLNRIITDLKKEQDK